MRKSHVRWRAAERHEPNLIRIINESIHRSAECDFDESILKVRQLFGDGLTVVRGFGSSKGHPGTSRNDWSSDKLSLASPFNGTSLLAVTIFVFIWWRLKTPSETSSETVMCVSLLSPGMNVFTCKVIGRKDRSPLLNSDSFLFSSLIVTRADSKLHKLLRRIIIHLSAQCIFSALFGPMSKQFICISLTQILKITS